MIPPAIPRLKALADQAAAAADDTGASVVVAKDEWYALLEAIYDADENEDEE